jgi:hypothetical protein
MSEQRRYSLDEIDRMRDTLRNFHSRLDVFSGGKFVGRTYDNTSDEQVERELRTLMLNGTDPAELEARWKERSARDAEAAGIAPDAIIWRYS